MKHKWLIPLIFTTVVALWAAHIYLQTGDLCLTQWARSERSGHVSEALSALFSGLAFAGLIIAILYQREELNLQRKELEQTREELRGQTEQLQIQNRTLKHQQFENTFFQLLRLNNEIVGSMHIFAGTGGMQQDFSGRDCFAGLWVIEYLPILAHEENLNRSAQAEDLIEIAYGQFFEKYQADLGHYFRTLYNAVKFVDSAQIEKPKMYTNLIRAQLSTFELLLLFYNCLSYYGRGKFKPLIERYSLLKGIPEDRLIDKSHKELYAKEAFS